MRRLRPAMLLALLAMALAPAGCGKKPGDPVPPPGADPERFPKTYPEPERLP